MPAVVPARAHEGHSRAGMPTRVQRHCAQGRPHAHAHKSTFAYRDAHAHAEVLRRATGTVHPSEGTVRAGIVGVFMLAHDVVMRREF